MQFYLQDDKAVIDSSGSPFETKIVGDKIVGESVILVVKGTNKALSVKQTYSGTPIMAVSTDSSSDSQKWFLV